MENRPNQKRQAVIVETWLILIYDDYMIKFPSSLITLLFLFLILSQAFIDYFRLGVDNLNYFISPSLFVSGWIIGMIVLQFDRFVDIYFTNPDTKLALVVKEYVLKNKWQNAYLIIKKNKHLQTKLTFHSALFQIIWVLLVVFTLSSTNSIFGQGFILGLGFSLLLEEWGDYFKDKDILKKWLFWQINKDISNQDLKYYLIFLTLAFLYFLGIYLY